MDYDVPNRAGFTTISVTVKYEDTNITISGSFTHFSIAFDFTFLLNILSSMFIIRPIKVTGNLAKQWKPKKKQIPNGT